MTDTNSSSLAWSACLALVEAYARGDESNSIEWSDVDIAHELALRAVQEKQREEAEGRRP